MLRVRGLTPVEHGMRIETDFLFPDGSSIHLYILKDQPMQLTDLGATSDWIGCDLGELKVSFIDLQEAIDDLGQRCVLHAKLGKGDWLMMQKETTFYQRIPGGWLGVAQGDERSGGPYVWTSRDIPLDVLESLVRVPFIWGDVPYALFSGQQSK